MSKIKDLNLIYAIALSLLSMLLGGVFWALMYAYVGFSFWAILLVGFVSVWAFYLTRKKIGIFSFFYILITSLLINYFALIFSATISSMSLVGVEESFSQLFNMSLKVSFGRGLTDTILCILFTFISVSTGFIACLLTEKAKNRKENPDEHKSEESSAVESLAQIVQANSDDGENVVNEEDRIAHKLYVHLVNNISEILGEYYKTSDQGEFLRKFKKFREDEILKLSPKYLAQVQQLCLLPINNEMKDKARKLLLKATMDIKEPSKTSKKV